MMVKNNTVATLGIQYEYLDDESICSFDSRKDEDLTDNYSDDSHERSWRRRKRTAGQLRHQRHAANLRERRRMQSINDAFEGLRTHIPTLPYEKRLSKVDTLRLAIGYINFLADLLSSDRHPQDAAHGVSQEPPKKIIVSNRDPFENYSVHSISWTIEKEAGVAGPGTMITKLWTPEDPRTTKQKY
ncbi:hypothetical protein QYM36_013098 [Artemia franciscana]|uniref:BHLH domain-containing protein n=1 Tax=Artemia franciscana TaxID=6661 RepID=A0AA88HR00_ARTSF|nr:hypothetical protein QYM36_013098 [Artemia franciscana]